MPNDYFTLPGGSVSQDTKARAQEVRGLFAAVEAAFDLLPSPDAFANGTMNLAVDSGAANAYVLTLSPGPSSYTDGLTIDFAALEANTTDSTVNVNGLGVKQIRDYQGSQLEAGLIPAGGYVTIRYDGAVFRLNSVVGVTVPPDSSVTNAKLANMAESRIKGRAAGAGTGAPTDLTNAQVMAILTGSVQAFALSGGAPALTLENTGLAVGFQGAALRYRNVSSEGRLDLAILNSGGTAVDTPYDVTVDATGVTDHAFRIANTVVARIEATNASTTTLQTRAFADARFQPLVSASRFKDGIAAAPVRDLSALTAKTWVWGGALDAGDPRTGKRGFGLIAEDVDPVFPEAVIRDGDGKIAGLDALTMIGGLVEELRRAHGAIAQLQGALAETNGRLAALEAGSE